MTGSLKAIQEEGEGIISTDLVINKERVRVISIYGEQGRKNLEEKMEGCIKEGEERNLIMEGNLNIRIVDGNKGRRGGEM